MTDQVKLILIAALLVIAITIVVILVINTRKTNLKKDFEELNVRFNTVKTIPLAFKLNKAQAMAKRSEDTSLAVRDYYQKYEDAQKSIDGVGELIENIEDLFAVNNYKTIKETLPQLVESLEECEKEVKTIDEFLEQFSQEESDQRENSARLKEEFRELKLYVNKNSNSLSIANNGINKKIEAVEDLFSQSEEFMYINDYVSSQESLERIKVEIRELKVNVLALPELITDTKGVVPTLLDEVSRQYALSRQRGIFTGHLDLDEKIEHIKTVLSGDVRTLTNGDVTDVKRHNEEFKAELNSLLNSLNIENSNYQELKSKSDEVADNIAEIKKLINYVSEAYKKDKERFGLEDIGSYLKESEDAVNKYQADYMQLSGDISSNSKPATELKNDIVELLNKTIKDKKVLQSHKDSFDKNINDEQWAKTQLMKLQVVLNEVEVKVLEYHLPTIASTYQSDLQEGRDRIVRIKTLLNEVPIDVDELNKTLNDSIDFIYKFYNNVNNVVGMAIMVENAIVFGNKYRSSYPEVERDLSKAEFSYLNGEYTKALTMAIACMERLFPDKKDTSYLENS